MDFYNLHTEIRAVEAQIRHALAREPSHWELVRAVVRCAADGPSTTPLLAATSAAYQSLDDAALEEPLDPEARLSDQVYRPKCAPVRRRLPGLLAHRQRPDARRIGGIGGQPYTAGPHRDMRTLSIPSRNCAGILGRCGLTIAAKYMTTEPIYEPNPKHKEPWHYGRSGTLCPRWSWEIAQEILQKSDTIGKSRFAVRGGVAFKGHEHAPGKWHGHPVAWNEVPTRLVNQWIRTKRVTRREVRTLWAVEDMDQRLRGDPR